MGIDRPDDADPPSDNHSAQPPNRPPAETRYRQEYDADLRAATTPKEPAEPARTNTNWEETAELSRWMWTEYKRRWPPEERPPANEVDDSQRSSSRDPDRSPDSSDELEAECDNIAERERRTVSPALREVESCDTDRQLIGFEFRLKGRDRIKEKIAKGMDENGLSAEEAVATLPDAIRYTFQYDETRYTEGVRADIVRIKEQGFELSILKNSWLSDQYKGINSQWIEPESGQRFELQFHTRISFEAKQITHGAYERLRSGQPDPFEHMVLEAYQAKVTAAVQIPPGAVDIPDYPQRDRNAR